MKILFINFILSISFLFGRDLILTLSLPKINFYEEEEIRIDLNIKNKGEKREEIKIQYLQPREKNFLFIGDRWKLSVFSDGENLENFTNHIPPEPKPGEYLLVLEPNEEKNILIPFTFYYYPINLPSRFKVKLKYEDISSNEVEFSVLKSKGKKEDENFIINGDFKDGEIFPYGWKIENENIKWENRDIISFFLDRNTAEGEGLWIYSIFNEITAPSQYTLFIRCKSESPNIIIFVEGWGIVKGRRRRIERNECFIYPENEWKEYKFPIKFENENVKWFRIKLYAYLKEGKVYFDRVEMRKK